MKITRGSIWRCIEENSPHYKRLCVVKDINDNPDFNGDGTIELMYANGTRHYGKVRRFLPGITHKLVKYQFAEKPKPARQFYSDALSSMEAEVIKQLHAHILELSEDMVDNDAPPNTWGDIRLAVRIRRPGIVLHLAAEEIREKQKEARQ